MPPRSGPNKAEIFKGSVLKEGDAYIVTVNSRVTRATSVMPAFGFGPGFTNAGLVGSDTIAPGDVRLPEELVPLLDAAGHSARPRR